MSEEQAVITPWDQLAQVVDTGNADHVEAFVQLLPPGETAYTISRLDDEHRSRMLELIRPEFAADLMQFLSDEHAADLIEELSPSKAAAILDELPSDDQADILGELDEEDQQAILKEMEPAEAADARRLVAYDPDAAGGIMITEYVAFPQDMRIEDVLADLRRHAEAHAEHDVHYTYVVDATDRLVGVLTLRNLLLAPSHNTLRDVMTSHPISVNVDTPISELEDIFDRHQFYGLPVVEGDGRLVGVVHWSAVQEALGEQADRALMRFGGIIGGEELRTSPLRERTFRRLLFLFPNIALSFIAIQIISLYEPIIQEFTALAVFLPLVANLSGASGNQSVAVSLRELDLGLLKPRDVALVFRKEVLLGLINGVLIGFILAGLVLLTRWDQPWLALVVGSAFALMSVIAVIMGGCIPLIIKGLGADPAMASSPILTTITDAASFFIVLTSATVLAAVFLG